MPMLAPAGVVVTVDAPPSTIARVPTPQGPFSFRLQDLQDGRPLLVLDGDVSVQQTPTPQQVSGALDGQQDYPALAVAKDGTVWLGWQAYKDRADNVYAPHSTPAGWSEPDRLTGEKADVFETAIGEDAKGRIWAVGSERTNEDWDLYARSYDGRQWDERRKLTCGDHPDIFHRLVSDSAGGLHLIWTGYRNGESHVFWSKQEGAGWSAPVEVSGTGGWGPTAAADSKGNLNVVWDSYREGNYDVFLRRIGRDGTVGPIQQVTHSPRFQANATVTVDKRDRVWVAWDESGANWGKDWSHEDQWRSTVLYADRHIRVAVLEDGTWKQPAASMMAAVPLRYNRYVQDPRLSTDSAGRVWMAFQIRTSSGMNRADFWASNGRWEYFLTSYEGERWTPAIPVPESSSRPGGILQIAPGVAGVWTAWANDNRRFGPQQGFEAGPNRKANQEIDAAFFTLSGATGEPALEAFVETPGAAAALPATEAEDRKGSRGYQAIRAATR